MPKVIIRENETFEDGVKRFKRLVNKSNILADYRKHNFYVKPGLKRRLKDELARRNKRKY